jgi:hypothetical protein
VHIKEGEKVRESYVQYECKETKIMYPFVCRCNSAGSRNADCLHDWRETNPTSAGPKGFIDFVLHLFGVVSKGCRSKRSRNVRISRFGGCGRTLAGRACGRKGLVGERREPAPSQMSHKAKMRKTANRKTTLNHAKEEMRR